MDEPLQSLKLIRKFVLSMYGLEIRILDSPDAISAYCEECMLASVQKPMLPGYLSSLIQNAEPNTLYIMTDSFHIYSVLLLFQDKPILLGPFCTLIMTKRNVKTLVNRYELSDSSIRTMLAYRSQFPVLEETMVLQIADFLLQLSHGDGQEAIVRIVRLGYSHSSHDDPKRASYHEVGRKEYGDIIRARYSMEQQFIRHVEQGNARAAITDLRIIQRDVTYLKAVGATLQNERLGAAITRTNLRMAALRAGLSPELIDEISTKNTEATLRAETIKQIQIEVETMVRLFCKEIKAFHDSSYSNMVLSVIYCFEHYYSEDLSISGIAQELGVTTSYLIATFRKETGETPVSYLRRVRMSTAARLLTTSSLSIQEIASQVGVSDYNYFIKLFRQEYGDTPAKFRKRHNGSPNIG